jgi:hypothetical protein
MKSLKRHLQEIENARSIRLTESNIVKTRLRIGTSISDIISEVKYLKKQKYSTEIINENLISILNQMFQEDGPGFMDTVKNKLTSFLIQKLNLSDFEKGVVEKAIGETEVDDVPRLFTDARFLSQKLAEVYKDGFESDYLENLPDFMKGKIGKMMQDNQSQKELEDSFYDLIRPVMGDVNSKMELKMKDIRDNIVS